MASQRLMERINADNVTKKIILIGGCRLQKGKEDGVGFIGEGERGIRDAG